MGISQFLDLGKVDTFVEETGLSKIKNELAKVIGLVVIVELRLKPSSSNYILSS